MAKALIPCTEPVHRAWMVSVSLPEVRPRVAQVPDMVHRLSLEAGAPVPLLALAGRPPSYSFWQAVKAFARKAVEPVR